MRQQNLRNTDALHTRDDDDKFGTLILLAANLQTCSRMHFLSKRQVFLLNHDQLSYFAFFRRRT